MITLRLILIQVNPCHYISNHVGRRFAVDIFCVNLSDYCVVRFLTRFPIDVNVRSTKLCLLNIFSIELLLE